MRGCCSGSDCDRHDACRVRLSGAEACDSCWGFCWGSTCAFCAAASDSDWDSGGDHSLGMAGNESEKETESGWGMGDGDAEVDYDYHEAGGHAGSTKVSDAGDVVEKDDVEEVSGSREGDAVGCEKVSGGEEATVNGTDAEATWSWSCECCVHWVSWNVSWAKDCAGAGAEDAGHGKQD